MQVKVYVVIEVKAGSERIIAARLTNKAARDIARLAPNRAVKLFVATKDSHIVEKERQQHIGGRYGDSRDNPRSN